MAILYPDKTGLRKRYLAEHGLRSKITSELERFLEKSISGLKSHLMVKARPKSFESYFKKYLVYLKNSNEEEPLIPDQIGLRVICPFLEDVNTVVDHCGKVFTVLEIEQKGSNYSFKEFGYESIHLLVKVPPSILSKFPDLPPHLEQAEIQVRTILQDAWAEVEHELVYKSEFTPYDESMKRKLAALNASLSLADTIFQEIRVYQRQLKEQLNQRHTSFFKQIEDSIDVEALKDSRMLVNPGIDGADDEGLIPAKSGTDSLDDLLLNGLYAHNKGEFDKAIRFYSIILDKKPEEKTQSLVYKHRGMAYFAVSRYVEALSDFDAALSLDPASYKAAYYRAMTLQVSSDYAGAIPGFTRSLEINPYQPYCLFRRAQAYYHVGDYPAALADCEAALSINPDLKNAYDFRRLLQSQLDFNI